MLIYGSKMYGTKNLVQGFGECQHCGGYGQHRSYDGRKFGHLYFIPLIPMGGHVRVMKECAHCSMGSHFPRDHVIGLYQRIESLMQSCVIAAGEGSRLFTDPEGGVSHNGPFLLEAVDLLYTAGYASEIPPLIELLDNDAARFEHGIASGAFAEIRGDATAAYVSYQSASEAAPDEPLPYMLMSGFQMRSGQPQQALDLLERACAIEPDDVQLMLSKAGPLEALGRFQELLDLIDRAIALAPQLADDKPFMKMRKKFAKRLEKAGR